MKELTCKYEFWEGRQVESLPINQLWQSVPKANVVNEDQPSEVEFYEPIKKDIQDNGMEFPVLVVRVPMFMLIHEHAKHPGQLNPLPNLQNNEIINVVWGGSNRLIVGMDLECTHIDCVVYTVNNSEDDDPFRAAWIDQAKQRSPYLKQFYNRG